MSSSSSSSSSAAAASSADSKDAKDSKSSNGFEQHPDEEILGEIETGLDQRGDLDNDENAEQHVKRKAELQCNNCGQKGSFFYEVTIGGKRSLRVNELSHCSSSICRSNLHVVRLRL